VQLYLQGCVQRQFFTLNEGKGIPCKRGEWTNKGVCSSSTRRVDLSGQM